MIAGATEEPDPKPSLLGDLSDIMIGLEVPIRRSHHKLYRNIGCPSLHRDARSEETTNDPSSYGFVKELLLESSLPLGFVNQILDAYRAIWDNCETGDGEQEYAARTFTLFKELPPELRFQIWEAALPGRFIIPTVNGYKWQGWETSHAGRLARLAQVCSEAKQVATSKRFDWLGAGLPSFPEAPQYKWVYPCDYALVHPNNGSSVGRLPVFSSAFEKSRAFLEERDVVYFRGDIVDRPRPRELVGFMKGLRRVSVLETYVHMDYRFDSIEPSWPFALPTVPVRLGALTRLDDGVRLKRLLRVAHPGTSDCDLEGLRKELVEDWEYQAKRFRKGWVECHVENEGGALWREVFPHGEFNEAHPRAREALQSLPPMEQSLLFIWQLYL